MLGDAAYSKHWEEKKKLYQKHGIVENDNLIVSIVVFSLFFKFIVVFFVKLFADIKIVLTFAAHNKGNSK